MKLREETLRQERIIDLGETGSKKVWKQRMRGEGDQGSRKRERDDDTGKFLHMVEDEFCADSLSTLSNYLSLSFTYIHINHNNSLSSLFP